MTAIDRFWYLWARRIEHRYQTDKNQVLLQILCLEIEHFSIALARRQS
jgi:hypothetical protein